MVRFEPLYLQLADQLAAEIEGGHFQPGQRLPSVRSLMASRAVSLATVMGALQALADRGLILSRPRAGYFAAPRRGEQTPRQSAGADTPRPVRVQHVISELNRAKFGQEGVNLGSAVVATELVPSAEIVRAVQRVARRDPVRLAAEIIPAPGLEALRIGIARMMLRRGVMTAPEDIVITNGDANAMEAALRLILKPGQAAAVESPTYFGILQILERAGIPAQEIATDPGSGLRLEALEASLATGRIGVVIVNPTFHNPFGCTMPASRKQALVEIAGRYGVPIIEDDVFGDIHYGPHRPPALKSFDREGMVLHCSSFSKMLTPGWRIGWILAGRWRDEIVEEQLITSTGVSSLPQLALAEMLAGRFYSRHIEALRRLAASQAPRLRELVLASFPEGTRISDPAGGFLFWIECPSLNVSGLDALALASAARREGIAVAPGPIFSANGGFGDCLRLSAGLRLTPRVEAAICRLGELARASRPGSA